MGHRARRVWRHDAFALRTHRYSPPTAAKANRFIGGERKEESGFGGFAVLMFCCQGKLDIVTKATLQGLSGIYSQLLRI